MDYAREERIGNPDLFTGRKKELDYFLKWINDIKERKSQSTALMARRKMGKSALMERLFNITFFKNDGVIPFYYEIKENDVWVLDFCQDFFLTFIYQYIAFKSRNPVYLTPEDTSDFNKALNIAKQEGLDYLCGTIEGAAHAAAHEKIGILWNIVREAPHNIASRQKEFIVQLIDEFQFLNSMIYWDKDMKNPAKNLAGGYLSTAESKIAPLLVTGSWVGWLMDLLKMMLPARFKYKSLINMPEDEALEMIYKFSDFFKVPITDETAYLIYGLCEGSPFYISSLIRSEYGEKDLSSLEGLARTLEFETLTNQGVIKSTWMEYVKKAFKKVNDRDAKRIVIYLFKHKGKELTRKQLINDLKLVNMTDEQLEDKLEALVKGDIIEQGQSNYRYRSVADNIFDKVFRGVYQDEIENFDAKDIIKEYEKLLKNLSHQYRQLMGKYSYRLGYSAEYLILDGLKLHARKKNELLKSITRNLPVDFAFCKYARVWRYDSSPEYACRISVDIFARAENPADYSIIGEVKYRDSRKFSKEEVMDFERKFETVKKLENIERAVGFIFSRSGFTAEAEAYCQEKNIASSEDERWFDW